MSGLEIALLLFFLNADANENVDISVITGFLMPVNQGIIIYRYVADM